MLELAARFIFTSAAYFTSGLIPMKGIVHITTMLFISYNELTTFPQVSEREYLFPGLDSRLPEEDDNAAAGYT